MKKGKKVYVLITWTYDMRAEYKIFNNRKLAFLERPFNKTFNKALREYGYYWQDNSFWPNCVIDCYDSIHSFNCGKDPVYTKTYYK